MDEAENKVNINTVKGLVMGDKNIVNYYGISGQEQLLDTPSQVWNIPYQRNQLFIGRDDLLCQIHETYMRNRVGGLTQLQVISGLGGIGKTQLVIEYAYRYHEEYRFILWVNADSRETIITSFLELARYLHLPNLRNPEDTVAAVKDWCANHDRWLLIFDNADDPMLMEETLPSGGQGHLLLTTRNQTLDILGNPIEVEQLDRSEGILLLLRRARVLGPKAPLEHAFVTDLSAAQSIVQVMDDLPLALDQAGAYINETHCSLTSYLKQLDSDKREAFFLRRRGSAGMQHPQSVAKTWSLSFAKVAKLNPLAADLLRCCAFLAPDAIP